MKNKFDKYYENKTKPQTDIFKLGVSNFVVRLVVVLVRHHSSVNQRIDDENSVAY